MTTAMVIEMPITKTFNDFSKKEIDALEASIDVSLLLFNDGELTEDNIETEMADILYTTDLDRLNNLLPNGEEVLDRYIGKLHKKLETLSL